MKRTSDLRSKTRSGATSSLGCPVKTQSDSERDSSNSPAAHVRGRSSLTSDKDHRCPFPRRGVELEAGGPAVLGQGVYSLSEAARYTEVPPATLRSWFKPR